MNETYLETQTVSYPPAPKKGPGVMNILTIVFGLFSLILLCALAGVGYWAYTLNTNLNTTRVERDAWHAKFDTATTEKNKLTTDLNQTKATLDTTKAELDTTKAELETTKAELATTKTDLESARSDAAAKQAKIDKALKYLAVFDGFWDDTYAETEAKIKATGDSTLLSKYNQWKSSKTSDDFWSFFDTFIAGAIDTLR